MTHPTTQELLSRLESLMEKATPGPFHAEDGAAAICADLTGWFVCHPQTECDATALLWVAEQKDADLIAEGLNALPTLISAIRDLEAENMRLREEREWRPIESAPKDRTVIWAAFHPCIYPDLRPEREDLERWNGVQVPIRHPGVVDGIDGEPFDMGWSIAAPVGHGGFPDEWIIGWMPLPDTAAIRGVEK